MKDQTLHTIQFTSGPLLTLVHGDLTEQKVDAIVNAANAQLMHGGGIAAMIEQRGGEVVRLESRAWVRQHGPVTHTQPAYTSAGKLPCRYIIHAVGPVWGSGKEDQKLTDAVKGSLRLAENLSLTSIAFPAISTGIFGFPKERAARVTYQAFKAYFAENLASKLSDVRMLVYDWPTRQAFDRVWIEEFGE